MWAEGKSAAFKRLNSDLEICFIWSLFLGALQATEHTIVGSNGQLMIKKVMNCQHVWAVIARTSDIETDDFIAVIISSEKKLAIECR